MNEQNNIELKPVWTVVANIVNERHFGPGGQKIKIGTKHFRPGAKVYIVDWYAGMCEDIIVVGIARKPRRFIKVVIRANWVENLRIKLCYEPKALEKIYKHFDSENDNIERLDKEFAETMFQRIPLWQQEMITK